MATTKAGSKKAREKAPAGGRAAKKALAEKASTPAVVPPPGGPSEFLDDTPLTLTAELGRTRITLDHALGVGEQSLIELDKLVGDPVDILINGRLFARGEVVTVSEYFGVRIVEVVGPA